MIFLHVGENFKLDKRFPWPSNCSFKLPDMPGWSFIPISATSINMAPIDKILEKALNKYHSVLPGNVTTGFWAA